MDNICLGVILEETINELAALKPIGSLQPAPQTVPGGDSSAAPQTQNNGTGKSLLLPSHERLVNHRKYMSDHLEVMDMNKLDQRIHKQASRYKTRCRTFLDEIQDHCDKYQIKIPGTLEADCLKMASELDNVLQVLIAAANELEKGNISYLEKVVEEDEKQQNELKCQLERYYETQNILNSLDKELEHAHHVSVQNVRQQELYLKAMQWYIGEQQMNLAKEKSYSNKSAEAAIARIDRVWQKKLSDIRKEIATNREKTANEDQSNAKSTLHMNELLEKTKASKRESITECDSELNAMGDHLEDLKSKIRAARNHSKDLENEKERIKEFNLMFESEMEKFKRDAMYRRQSKIAATRIQSLWRGCMVRKGLGQFRYLRKKGKRKGRKGKKGAGKRKSVKK